MMNGSQMKGIHKKTTANDILNSKLLKAFSEIRRRCPVLLFLSTLNWRSYAIESKASKKNENVAKNETKLSLFADDPIANIDKSKRKLQIMVNSP